MKYMVTELMTEVEARNPLDAAKKFHAQQGDRNPSEEYTYYVAPAAGVVEIDAEPTTGHMFSPVPGK